MSVEIHRFRVRKNFEMLFLTPVYISDEMHEEIRILFFCGGGTNSDFKKSQYQKNNLMSVIGCDELEHT